MDYRTLKKINDLALSLKENRIAANMDEAVDLAKNMLTRDVNGMPLTQEQLEKAKEQLSEENKELKELIGESDALKMDARFAHEREHHQSVGIHQHEKEFSSLKNEVESTKKTVKALKDIQKDAKGVEKSEHEGETYEEAADEDLPGESPEGKD